MSPQFQVGAAHTNITPTLGAHMQGSFSDRVADDVADELYARAIVMTDGDTAMAIVVCDIVGAYKDDLAVATYRASELTGIPQENILISCTHTHYGPNTLALAHLPYEKEYTAWAMQKIGDVVRLAWNRLQPAVFGHASGSCPEETHNRRWHMRDGSVRMNPGYQNPDLVRPAGPTDPEVGVAVFLDASHHPIAVLGNYSLHYVSSGAGTAISANYFGAFSRAMQRMAGADIVAIMANGCCGDVNNCDFTRPAPAMPHPHYQEERVGNIIASRAYAAWQQIRDFSDSPTLAAAAGTVDFQRREPDAEALATARVDVERREELGLIEWVYALETSRVADLPLIRETPVMAFRIGDLGIAAMPGEMFVDYGLQIKAQSPFARTMVIELANDYIGYCPTDQALEEGGYETRLSTWAMAAPGTEAQMVGAAGKLLDEIAC